MKDSYQINMYSPRYRMDPMNDSPDKSVELSKSVLARDEEHLNFLKTLYFILCILSVFLSLFSYYTWTYSMSHSVLFLSLVSLGSFLSGVFGILGSFKGIKDLKYRHLILAGEKEGQGKNFLMISFFLMLLTFSLLLVFGSHALFYSERTMSYLQATHEEGSEDVSLKSRNILLLITISGYTAYLLLLVKLLIIHFAFLLSLLYDSIDRIFEILNLNILNLGLGMVYITFYCLKYHEHIKFLASIQNNTLYSVSAVSLCLCGICLLGFFTVRSQTLSWVRLYFVCNFFMIIICAFSATVSVKSTHLFKEGLSENCFDFMAIVHSNYLRGLGCESKYLNTSNDEDSKCSEGTTRVIWESGITEEFGCLNTQCCDILITDAKTKFDYLGICSGAAVGVIFLALWACYFIWNKLNSNLAHLHKLDLKVIIWAILAPLITAFLIFYYIPDPPYLPQYLEALQTVKGATALSPLLFTYDWKYKNFPVENVEKCQNCGGEYQTLISTVNGKVNHEEFTSGDGETVLNYLQTLEFKPTCPNLPHYIGLDVYKRENSNLSKVSEFRSFFKFGNLEELFGEVYPRDFQVVYKGECLNVSKSEEKVKVQGFSHFYRTASLETLFFFADGFLPVTRSVQIGGLPIFPYTLPPTFLLKPSEQTRVSFKVFSMQDDPISSFSIELRTGYNNFSGPCTTFNFSYMEGILKLDKQVYSVVTKSEGFKDDRTELVDQTFLRIFLTSDDFLNNEIRVVLSWQSDSDLDLRAKFKFNENFECEIASFNKICGNSRLTVFSKGAKNVEEIRILKVAPVHYLFYVKEVVAGKEPFYDARAVVKVFVKAWKAPVVVLAQQRIPAWGVDWIDYRIWNSFCLDGRFGVSSLAPVQAYMSVRHLKYARSMCAQVYGEERNLTSGSLNSETYENLRFPTNLTLD